MKKIAIVLFIVSLFTTSCKKEIEAVCDITFDSPAEGQVFDSGDTIKVNITNKPTLYNSGDSMNLIVAYSREIIYVEDSSGNYTYSFVPVITDGIIDTIKLDAIPGSKHILNGAICRKNITIYVQP